ncbi:MAG: Fur family transcriptional regulator [Leptospiraceae bacterium]|jgi:Fur family ferric uptake transcriptional regulator|nr:Fur family transcriptional regulator [Leptospiraceae bacterium]MCZ8344805.1 Fur family transcriptional regulator [Leptospiraceae bacterium]PJE02144.1 MAG: transcriptional repressor [Leptospira sp.]
MADDSIYEIHEDTSMEMTTFSNYLKKKGLKITTQRMLVAEKIFSIHNHFTAESLQEELKDRRDEISKATIYRILSIMVEAGLLQEHNFGKDYKYYEHIIGHEHHDHIICIECGRIVEFMDEKIEELQRKAAREKGFTITGHDLNIFGICDNPPTCTYNKKNSQ